MSEVPLPPKTTLRDPFPSSVVGILPKPYRKDSPKGECPECGGYHGLPAIHLDYVGHAAVTDRLLTVDPYWNWEPLEREADPAVWLAAIATGDIDIIQMVWESFPPKYDARGGLWIKLTIDGMTRLGYGDGPDPKQRIGDAIRNAAMRFGVALDLWTKDELESQVSDTKSDTEAKKGQSDDPVFDARIELLKLAAKQAGYGTPKQLFEVINPILERPKSARWAGLTVEQIDRALEHMKQKEGEPV